MDYAFSQIFLILPVAAALASFGLGLFVFSKNIRHPANIGFGLGMLCLSIISGGNALFLISNSLSLSMLGKRFSLIGEALLPSTWFLFSLTFARANYREVLSRWKVIWAVLTCGSLFFIFWINSPAFVSLPLAYPDNNILPLGVVGRYFYIFLILGMIVNVIHLENTLRFSIGTKRQEIKYLLIGVGAILAFNIYLASKAILFSSLTENYIHATSAVFLIAFSIIAFAIVTQRLLDVDIFISRYVIYNSLTLLIVGAYLLVMGLIAQAIKLVGGSFDIFWGVLLAFLSLLGMVTLLLSTRFRRKIQNVITRHFYKHKYEFRDKWMETVECIGNEANPAKIQRWIVDMISETMGAKEVYLWLFDNINRKYNLVSTNINHSGNLDIAGDHPLVFCMKKSATPFIIEDMLEKKDVSGKEEIAPLIVATNAVMCTPLLAGDELMGFILQGEDISGEPYRKDDIELLKAIASHAASRFKDIRLTQEVMAAKEAETFHYLSVFFIHDVKNLISPLQLLVQNAGDYINNPEFQQDAIMTLKKTVTKMEDMVSNLSLLSRGIKIDQRPVNLNEIIEDTLAYLNGNMHAKLVKNFQRVPDILADGEQLRTVILNLILNAIDASPPHGKINLQLFARHGEIVLSVVDHGSGMSREFINSSLFRPFRTTKSKGLGIGLYQCKKIVEAHAGRIEVESEEGKGSVFRVVLPLGVSGVGGRVSGG